METTENLNKAAINNGLIIGIIGSVLGILPYYVAPSLMGSLWYGLGIGIISLVIYIVLTFDLRKKIGGYWTFREALRGIFLMAFIAGIIVMIVNNLFFKLIEPGAFAKISGYVQEGLSSTFSKMGMNQDQIDIEVAKAVQRLKAQLDPGPKELLIHLGVSVLIQFIMSLIFAAIFKKDPPIFAPTEEEE
ncbi:MAG TPA: hypothetical protein DIT07_06930 [Sphingobacteriaceae bacterium]|nr:hypothetical protein [Sphingobacteriaceae bacterium]